MAGLPTAGWSRSGDALPKVPGYRILGRAASGGMGVVYRGVAEHSGQAVAVKVVWPEEHGQVAASRIAREVQALSRLRHPGIVRFIDHGTTDAGQPFLVMEWLEGLDLEARLRRGPLTVEEALALVSRLAEALVVAHGHGVIHRDIKPGNVLLVEGRPGRARLLDFGIARLRGGASTLTLPGRVIGSPGYMSPEQARGDEMLDPRSDLFSLGCVLYECLCGQPAFRGEHIMAVLAKILMESPPRLGERVRGIPRALDELVEQLLHKEPALRLPSAERLVERLAALDHAEPGPLRAEPAVLTEREQVLRSVLFSRGEGGGVDLASLAAEHRGRYVTLVDGTRLVVIESTPVASDQAATAARCALALHRRAPRLAVAVASGQGMVTGRTIEGRVLDRGAALLQRTGPGHVRIDEVTASLLDASFEVGGDDDGLTVLAAHEAQPGARRLMGLETPMVGRRRELALLVEALDECIEEPCAAAAVVVGEAGTGKSRLCDALCTRAAAREGPVTLLAGRAEAMGTHAPFALMARVLRSAVGLRDGEEASVSRQKLRARISRHVAAEQVDRVTLYLGEIVGAFAGDAPLELKLAREASGAMRARIEDAWCTWLRAETRAGPVLLVLEDLHWADAATVQVLDATLDRLEDEPLLVLALARPPVDERFPALWARREVQRLSLAPLSARAARKLVRQVLGPGVDPADVERIVGGARGNAFFLEELIRAVADGPGGELPDSVLGMMQARMAGLTAAERQVLRAASVFGRTAWRGGIHELSSLGPRTVDAAIDRLVEAEWLTSRPHSQIPGEAEFVFRHGLAHDAAYASLVEADRHRGHQRAGRWLERVGGQEAVVLAEHYDRGQEHERAVEWLALAADRAFERHEFDVVLELAQRGLAMGTAGPSRGRLRLRQAEVHAVSGRHDEAAEAAQAALDELPRDSPRWYAAAGEAALAIGRAGQTDRVRAMVERLMEMEFIGEGGAIYLMGLVRAAVPLAAAGEAVAARRLLDKLIEVLSALMEAEPEVAGPMHSAITLRAVVSGDLGTAYENMAAAAKVFEDAGSIRNALEHYAGAGFMLLELGDYERGEALLRQTIARAAELRLEHVSAVARHNLGHRVAEAGRIDEGLLLEREALASFEHHRNGRMVGLTLRHIAAIHLLAGDLDQAWRQVEAALEWLADNPASRAIARATRARVGLARGDAMGAQADARGALMDLESVVQVQEGESLVRLVWAEALAACGREPEAREALGAAWRSLMERAGRIESEALRGSYLRAVPENARTVALAEAWGVAGGEGVRAQT